MDNYDDDEDLDGSEDREAMSMVLAHLGDAVKAMRRKKLQQPAKVKTVEVSASPDGESGAVDSLALGDGELTEAELEKLEALC